MLQAAVCDDEPVLANRLSSFIRLTLKEKGIPCIVDTFVSGTELVRRCREYDLFFLDLEMPEMDGLMVGRSIRKRHPDCRIIIVSGMEDRLKDSFEIDAKWFVSKPVKSQELSHALDRALMQLPGQGTIDLYLDHYPKSVKQLNISYVEANGSHTHFYVDDIRYRRSEGLKYIIPELDNRLFAKINRGQLVNLHFAVPAKDYSVVMVNDQKLPVAKPYRKSFRKQLNDFDLTYEVL